MTCLISPSLVTSHLIPTQSIPYDCKVFAAFFTATSFISDNTIFAPSLPKSRLISYPIPLAAPVIRTTLLSTIVNPSIASIKFQVLMKTMGLPPVISTLFFPTIIEKFQDAYPNVTLMLAEDGAKTVERKVYEGEVDLGFVMLPVDHEKYEVVPFVDQEIKLLVHESHPLAHHNTLDLIQFKDDPFLLLSKEFTLNSRTVEFCISEGFTPKIAYESSQWDFIVGMVEKNLGVTLMPKLICDRVKDGPFKMISLTHTFPWRLGIIMAKNRYIPYVSREFISLVEKLPKV